MKNLQNYLYVRNVKEAEKSVNHYNVNIFATNNVASSYQYHHPLLPGNILIKLNDKNITHLSLNEQGEIGELTFKQENLYVEIYEGVCRYGRIINEDICGGVIYLGGLGLHDSEIGTMKGTTLNGLGQKNNEIGFYKNGSNTGIEISFEDKVLIYKYIDTLRIGEFNENIISQILQLEEKYYKLLSKKEKEEKFEKFVEFYQLSNGDLEFYKEMIELDERIQGVIMYFLLDPRDFTYNEIRGKIQKLLQTQSLGGIEVDLSYGGSDGLHTLEYEYLTTFTFNELKKIYYDKPEKFLRFYNFTKYSIDGATSIDALKDTQFFINHFGMNKYELEQYFFNVYTGRYFDLQEGRARGNQYILRIVLMYEMIRKLPKFEGIVYRGLEFSNTEDRDNFIKNFSGKITGVENFSTNKEYVLGFLGDSEASVLLEVHTKNAHYLGVSPDYDDGRGYFDDVENHAWFEVGTELEIVKIIEKDGVFRIILKDRESNALSK